MEQENDRGRLCDELAMSWATSPRLEVEWAYCKPWPVYG